MTTGSIQIAGLQDASNDLFARHPRDGDTAFDLSGDVPQMKVFAGGAWKYLRVTTKQDKTETGFPVRGMTLGETDSGDVIRVKDVAKSGCPYCSGTSTRVNLRGGRECSGCGAPL